MLQQLYLDLFHFWSQQGCLVTLPYDIEKGAGTFGATTFFGALGPKPSRVCSVEPSRRPVDGRYGQNPNRLYIHHQFQVIIKPVPSNIQDLYCQSLQHIGINLDQHDLRFVQDDWKSPTLGASGLGWEVWLDGMEITQYTYFQQMASIPCDPITVELTYGLERIAMYLQNKDNIYHCNYGQQEDSTISYADLFQRREYECSVYNFEVADRDDLLDRFERYEHEQKRMIDLNLLYPAYEFLLKAAHIFNLIDAKNIISTTDRVRYIQRVRDMAKSCAGLYLSPNQKEEKAVTS